MTELVKASVSGPQGCPDAQVNMRKDNSETKSSAVLALWEVTWLPKVLVYCDALLQTAHRYFQMEMLKFLPFSHQQLFLPWT